MFEPWDQREQELDVIERTAGTVDSLGVDNVLMFECSRVCDCVLI